MNKPAFIDELEITACGGDGGNGIVSFLRERARPRGGPNGGDGGVGGSVFMHADESLNTLLALRWRRKIEASKGSHGMGKNRQGANGEDEWVAVPAGTRIFDADTGFLHADLSQPGDNVLLAAGGRGGRGNTRFKTSANRAPRTFTKGEEGENRRFYLELQMLANICLVGLPNAGKSTLLSAISAARPKIADYPFTTLTPQLGFITDDLGDGLVVADIPGLIDGAADGAGLGNQFLRHIVRTRLLCQVIDVTDEDPLAACYIVNKELENFSAYDFGQKPRCLVLNKMDLVSEDRCSDILSIFSRNFPDYQAIHAVSALSGGGIVKLIKILFHSYASLSR